MKKLCLILALSPILIFAQESSLENLAPFSEADSNKAHVMVSGKAFEMMAKMEIDSAIDEAVQNLASGISGMEAYMEFTASTADEMIQSIEKQKGFTEYASYVKSDEIFKFYVKEKDGIVSEMIMLAREGEKGYAASVYGKMDLKDVGKLYKLVNMRGFNYMNGNED